MIRGFDPEERISSIEEKRVKVFFINYSDPAMKTAFKIKKEVFPNLKIREGKRSTSFFILKMFGPDYFYGLINILPSYS